MEWNGGHPALHAQVDSVCNVLLYPSFSDRGAGRFFFLSNSYYAEFAKSQEELLESYYHYIDKCMEDATRTSLRIIADDSIQQELREIMTAGGTALSQAKPTCMIPWSRPSRRFPATAISEA